MDTQIKEEFSRDEVLWPFPRVEGYPKVGRYLLTQNLGRGGMGVVYRAFHTRLEQDRAMKFILPEHVSQETIASFIKEAQKAARVDHPNVVKIHDVDDAPEYDRIYLVMEFIKGETLQERVTRKGPLALSEALAIAAAAADGLAAIHSANIVHRDIKPGNFMITMEGVVKVNDFGLARSFDGSRISGTHKNIQGTPFYMSPEHFLTPEKVSPASDVWALAATLYFLLTGRHAFSGDSVVAIGHQICSTSFPRLSSDRADIPATVDDILRRCTEKDPQIRLSSASDLSRLLRQELSRHAPPRLADPESGAGSVRVMDVSPPPSAILKSRSVAASLAEEKAMAGIPRTPNSRRITAPSARFFILAFFLLATLGGSLWWKYGDRSSKNSSPGSSLISLDVLDQRLRDAEEKLKDDLSVESGLQELLQLTRQAEFGAVRTRTAMATIIASVVKSVERRNLPGQRLLALGLLSSWTERIPNVPVFLTLEESIERNLVADVESGWQVLKPELNGDGRRLIAADTTEIVLHVNSNVREGEWTITARGVTSTHDGASGIVKFNSPGPGRHDVSVRMELVRRPRVQVTRNVTMEVLRPIDPRLTAQARAESLLQTESTVEEGLAILKGLAQDENHDPVHRSKARDLYLSAVVQRVKLMNVSGRRTSALQYLLKESEPFSADTLVTDCRKQIEETLRQHLQSTFLWKSPAFKSGFPGEIEVDTGEVQIEFTLSNTEGPLHVRVNGDSLNLKDGTYIAAVNGFVDRLDIVASFSGLPAVSDNVRFERAIKVSRKSDSSTAHPDPKSLSAAELLRRQGKPASKDPWTEKMRQLINSGTEAVLQLEDNDNPATHYQIRTIRFRELKEGVASGYLHLGETKAGTVQATITPQILRLVIQETNKPESMTYEFLADGTDPARRQYYVPKDTDDVYKASGSQTIFYLPSPGSIRFQDLAKSSFEEVNSDVVHALDNTFLGDIVLDPWYAKADPTRLLGLRGLTNTRSLRVRAFAFVSDGYPTTDDNNPDYWILVAHYVTQEGVDEKKQLVRLSRNGQRFAAVDFTVPQGTQSLKLYSAYAEGETIRESGTFLVLSNARVVP